MKENKESTLYEDGLVVHRPFLSAKKRIQD